MATSDQHIIVHAGFHKTGTTAVQDFFFKNGPLLWPHTAFVGPARINDVTRLATLHSTTGDPVSLGEFKGRLVAFLKTLDIGKKRHLVISSENLAGLIPGRSRHADYAACPALMRATQSAVRAVFGTQRQLHFYISTRAADPWLASSYWQNLRASRLQLDFDTYAKTYRTAADFGPIIAATRTALGETPLHTSSLEELRDTHLGPATPIIKLLPLPDDVITKLTPPVSRNASPNAEMIARVLAQNNLPQTDGWQAQKDALLASLT